MTGLHFLVRPVLTWYDFFVHNKSVSSVSSRKFTISFPEDLAKKVDLLAEQESRNVSELFREAFRIYFARRSREKLAEIREAAGDFNPRQYTREDTRKLVEDARRDLKALGK